MTSEELATRLSHLPRRRLCTYDTPHERMYHLEKLLRAGPLYIKRDDLNGVGSGGNKVRPLEYLLGEALSASCDVIVASGRENSNLCSIAAAACCRLGIRCILVHNDEKPKKLAGNILLNYLTGVEEHYIGTISDKNREKYVGELLSDLRHDGKKPYAIENGATGVHGAVGYIHLSMELAGQKNTHPLTDIFVPGGNGGLAAGVVLGSALLDVPFHVHVITVEHRKEDLDTIIRDLINGMEEYLGVNMKAPLEQVMTIHEEYRGSGWGMPTQNADEMIHKLAQCEGIFLERVYTGKAFYGMYDLLESQKVKADGACFIHSGGFSSLFYQYDGMHYLQKNRQ